MLLLRYAQIEGFINFFTFNKKNGELSQVVIRAEGTDKQLESLLHFISDEDLRPAQAEVTSITHHEFTGRVLDLSAYTQDLMFEQLSKGVPAILDIREMQRIMLDKQDQMLGKQDQMLDKQDQMLGNQDRMLDKQDQILDKQEGTIGEIRGLRQDMNKTMDQRFTHIEHELQTLKDALHKAGILADFINTRKPVHNRYMDISMGMRR